MNERERDMLKIAIVEDEKAYAETLARYCSRYAQEKQREISAACFENPVDFLEKYRGEYDVVFMDILMPMMDGMTCARRLREKDDTVILCFITSMAQYAIHGYEVGAMDFMVKPVNYSEFSMKLDRIFRVLSKRVDDSFLISSRNMVKKIDLRDLYYVEVYNHSLIFHTGEGSFEAYGKLTSLEEDSRFSRFIRVSPSHLVNCAQISSVGDDALTVHGKQLPVSRRRRKECLEKMAALLGGGC